MSAGIVVVDRLPLRHQRERARKTGRGVPIDALRLGDEVVAKRYRGLAGRPWPSRENIPIALEEGAAALDELPRVTQYLASLAERDTCDLLVVAEVDSERPPIVDQGWYFLGFDVGYYHSEWSSYSIVYYELIYGELSQPDSPVEGLNDNLLFDQLEDAVRAKQLHDAVASRGAPGEVVERGDMFPIAIFGRAAGGAY